MTTTTSTSNNSQNIVNLLGAGSGIDIKSLAQNLVDAERAPKKALIDGRIAKTEARITSYGAVKAALSELQAAFRKINDASDFASVTAAISQPAAFSVTTDAKAAAGRHDITITRTALGQRSISTAFSERGQTLGASPFDLSLSIHGGDAVPITVTTPTPAGIVSAINGAKLGISAQLIKSGDTDFRIVVNGSTGASNDFTLTTPLAGIDFSNKQQSARDALLNVDGLDITRSQNTLSDVIDGVTLNLYGATSDSASLELKRETGSIKANLQALVDAYNTFDENMTVMTDPKSTVETYGGSLAGDSLLQGIRNQVRSMLTGNFTLTTAGAYLAKGDTTSTRLNADVNAGRHVGLALDRFGKLSLDTDKLESALTAHFDQVVALFTANDSNQSPYATKPGGLAGDAVKSIERLLRSDGLINQQTVNASKQVSRYQDDLDKLEDRMSRLLEGYTRQFSVMESIVGNSNSLKTSLKSSFDGLMAAYTNK